MYCAVAFALVRAFGGAILCLFVALLHRSAPYPYWHWQGGHISELLKGIRGEHAEKYTLSVANCPGLFAIFSPRGKLNFLFDPHHTTTTAGYDLDPGSLSESRNGFAAQLNLAGPPCNAFGTDILNLTIQVTYDTASR